MHRTLVALALAVALPAAAAPWYEEMQIGPAWSSSFAGTFDGEERLAAVKGILVDLGEGQRALFDTETLSLVTAYRGGVHWRGTPWTGNHGQLVQVANEKDALFTKRPGPGWADAAGSLADPRPPVKLVTYTAKREQGETSAACGNIPQAQFKGHFRHGSHIVFDYLVHGTRVLESPQAGPDDTFVRHFEIAPHDQALTLLVADDTAPFEVADGRAKSAAGLHVSASGGGITLAAIGEPATRLSLQLAPSTTTTHLALAYRRGAEPAPVAPTPLAPLTLGGEGIWKESVTTQGQVATEKSGPWVTDTVTLPTDNPWKSNLRFGGFDFLDEDRAALCSWNGDVWIVSGLKGDWSKLSWKRHASGLFEALGLKVVDGVIHVHGRDQITKLHDLNGDGEADRYECFFNGVAVSPNFHEFAFDLQTDAAGDFYFSKAAPVRPGGRNFDTIFPHHGTVMKLSKDGSKLEVVATGLRAPGGLGVGPNGEITTGENEGTNQPCCKINYITKDQRPAFFGTEASRQQLTDAPYTEPLCYLPMDVDNSSGSQVWVPQGAKFGLHPGEMLHLSYGQSSIYRVLPASSGGTLQGGVVKLPIRLASSAMRARFHPDGSMYVLGFRGWQTNAASECAFHRVRPTGTPTLLPDRLEITAKGLRLHFESELDEELASDPESYTAQRWDYVRGPQYGSGEFSVDHPDAEARKQALEKESQSHRKRDNVTITAARLLDDGKTVDLELEGHKPSMQLKLTWDLEDLDGEVLEGALHATVRKLGP
jgi:hypothetical protein